MNTNIKQKKIGDYLISWIRTGTLKENCYTVKNLETGSLLIIDPGHDVSIITESLLKNENSLAYILLTHGHHDHVASVADLCEIYKIPCLVHEDDVRMLHHAPMYAIAFEKLKIKLPKPYRQFKDNQTFPFGKLQIKSLHTPGHTKGSVCYVFDKFVFTGDTLLFEEIGKTNLPGSCSKTISKSINHLIHSLPSDYIIFPGHGPSWYAEEARKWWTSYF